VAGSREGGAGKSRQATTKVSLTALAAAGYVLVEVAVEVALRPLDAVLKSNGMPMQRAGGRAGVAVATNVDLYLANDCGVGVL